MADGCRCLALQLDPPVLESILISIITFVPNFLMDRYLDHFRNYDDFQKVGMPNL